MAARRRLGLDDRLGAHLVARTFWLFATIFIFILAANWLSLFPGVGSIGWGHLTPEGFRLEQPFFRGANADVKGSVKIWVDTTGNVLIYEVVTKATVEVQGNSVDFSLTRRSEISGAGKTKVEIPEGVQKLLSEKPKAEEKKEDK